MRSSQFQAKLDRLEHDFRADLIRGLEAAKDARSHAQALLDDIKTAQPTDAIKS